MNRSDDLIDLTSDGSSNVSMKFEDSFDSQVAEVIVGGDCIAFLVDITTIQGHCPALWTSLHQFGEPVELVSEDPTTFNDYLRYLDRCDGKIPVLLEDYCLPLVEMWVLAEKLGDYATANNLVDTLRKVHKAEKVLPSYRSINIAIGACTPCSPLRRLVVDMWTHEGTMADYEKLQFSVRPEFWYTIATEYREMVEEVELGPGVWDDGLGQTLDKRPWCDYHFFNERGCASCGRTRMGGDVTTARDSLAVWAGEN